ncbi:MAG: hypothetical protein ACR2JR_03780 [Rubrobacteraceae bacterium]
MNGGRHNGEVALVTGANKGIGREISRRLAAEQGADLPVKLALLGADSPTGSFLGQDDSSVEAVVPW